MKKISTFLLVLLVTTIFAQAPAGYYDGTTGLTGYALKTKLSEIISNGHRDRGYNSLYEGYKTTDTDNYYEKDGSVLDMYSENPNGADPYNYQHGIRQCGNYTGENNCYNREHIVPQSTFGERAPMVSDIHHIPPTDGYVNNRRSNFPFGVVTNSSWTSRNGSKVGPNTTSGYSGTVFEPIDAFKGDVARMIFYFATRYQNQIPNFSSGTILDGTTTRSISQWELNILLEWHANDPVSQREIDRNNAAYTYQGNRNPYIDNPAWVNVVWGETSTIADNQPPTTPLNITVSNITGYTATANWEPSTDNIGVSGYNIYLNGVLVATTGNNTVHLGELNPNTNYVITIEAVDAAGNKSPLSVSKSFTTNTAPPPSGTAAELYFSEYVEGSGNNKALEISNMTGLTIDLTGYSIQKQANGSGSWTGDYKLSGSLSSGQTLVLRNSQSAFSCQFSAISVSGSPLDFNGNDAVGLFKNGVLIDIIGKYNDATIFAENVTLRRNVAVATTVYDPAQWDRFSVDSCDNLGVVNPASTLGTNDIANQKKTLSVSPNPVRNGQLQILGLEESIVRVEIYSVTGQLVQTAEKISKSANKINLRNLNKGGYILKAGNQTTKFIVE